MPEAVLEQSSPALVEPNPVRPPPPYKTCGAKKRNGEPCQGPAMRNGRCRLHGGKSLGGIASPHFRDGRRSKYFKCLPEDLTNSFSKAYCDADLLSLKDQMALLVARSMQLLERLKDTRAVPWGEALGALDKFLAAQG